MRLRYYLLAVVLGLLSVLGLVGSGPLASVLPVSTLHASVHLVAAACTAFAARRGLGAMRQWGKILGFSYAALAVTGWVMDGGATAWLHLGVALVFLYHALLAPPTL
jgi:hypothetical protein